MWALHCSDWRQWPRRWAAWDRCEVPGGRPLLLCDDGKPALAACAVGKGSVVVFADSTLVSTEQLGHVWNSPSPRQVQGSNLWYAVLGNARTGRDIQPEDAGDRPESGG